MQVLYPRCAGLDVHKDVIVACVRCVLTPVHQEVRSFQTTTIVTHEKKSAVAAWIPDTGYISAG